MQESHPGDTLERLINVCPAWNVGAYVRRLTNRAFAN